MSAQPPPPPSMGTVSRRVSGWTCNLLATAMILVAGLTFGRQALDWWYADPGPADAGEDAARTVGEARLGDESLPHLLELGDGAFVLRRATFQGDRAAAIDQLIRTTARVCRQSDGRSHLPGPAERRLLNRLAGEHASASDAEAGRPASWRVFQTDGPVPMVVGVRTVRTGGGPPASRDVADVERRVVCWGLGLAVSATDWTLFTYEARGDAAAASAAGQSLPLPDGSRRTMSLQVEGGGTLVGFRGDAAVGPWREFFDNRLAADGWSHDDRWRNWGGTWHARFVHPDGERLDVQLIEENGTATGGLLWRMEPPPSGGG